MYFLRLLSRSDRERFAGIEKTIAEEDAGYTMPLDEFRQQHF